MSRILVGFSNTEVFAIFDYIGGNTNMRLERTRTGSLHWATQKYVYHGTSESAARRALKRGILPRGTLKKGGNWNHTVPSNSEMVYLTSAYAPYYASAVTDTKKERIAIIQIDLGKLDTDKLYPDEDFIEQALRGKKLGNSDDMKKRTLYVRKHIADWQENWKKSLEYMGNVAFKGAVPPEAITKIVTFDPKSNPSIFMDTLNPTITLANYKFCGEKYRALTGWFFGGEVDPALLAFSVQIPKAKLKQLPWAAEVIAGARAQLARRDGVETIFDRRIHGKNSPPES
jgi:hypothetical protein